MVYIVMLFFAVTNPAVSFSSPETLGTITIRYCIFITTLVPVVLAIINNCECNQFPSITYLGNIEFFN